MQAASPARTIANTVWRILVIDDDEDDYIILRDMLGEAQGRKCDISWASTYEAGQEALKSAEFDAVLIDYNLGQHSGIQLIREANDADYPSPFILFTGQGSYEIDVEAMEAGATLYLVKGEVNALLLERSIRYAIELKQKERTLRMREAELLKNSAALRESEGRLRDFLEITNNNYIALDREWRLTYANPHYGKLMGVDPRDLIGKNYWDLFPQYRGSELEKNYRRVLEEGVPLHYQQGGIYTSSLYDVSVYPTNEGLAIFSIDRTEEIRHRRQLEDERARLEAVLQAMPAAVWIADRDGRLVFKNEQVDRIWGEAAPLSENDDQYKEYVAWFLDSGKPVAAEEFPVAKALKTGRPGAQVELRIRRFDGIERAVLATGAPIKDREGNLAGAVAINLDITEHKRAELALRESDSKYQAIFESSPFSIILARLADGVIVDVNPAWEELFEVPRAEAVGKTSLELGTAPDPETRQRGYAEMRATGRLRNFEMTFQNKSGRKFIGLNNAAVIEFNGTRYLLSVTEDITERKRAEEEQREHRLQIEIKSRLLDYREQERQMIAREIHDGPVQDLSSLLFNIELARGAITDPAGQLELNTLAVRLRGNVQYLREMINEMRPPALIRFGLVRALKVYLDDFKEKYPEVDLDISLEGDQDHLSERARLNLFRIAQEAIQNATRHGHATRITVKLAFPGRQTVLEIADNGKGFSISNSLIDYSVAGHFGLVGMQERAEALGGSLEITTRPRHGAIIRVTAPLES